ALFVHAYVYICVFPICASVYMCMRLCVGGWVLPVLRKRARKPLRVGLNSKLSVRSGADDIQACKLRS
ncbi:MAG: hypothetical protein ACPIOQ_63685, partial [Promethearchaeia archaeon]